MKQFYIIKAPLATRLAQRLAYKKMVPYCLPLAHVGLTGGYTTIPRTKTNSTQ